MSRLLKIIIPGLSIILILIGINNMNKEEVVFGNELKANSNLEVIQEQKVENFDLKGISIIYENGNTLLETAVTNTSDNDEYLKEFTIKLLENEKELTTLKGFVGDKIKAGETKIIDSYSGQDLTSATKIIYVVER